MKHLGYLTLSILALALVAATGCKKEEDPSIVGTWKITSAVFNPAVTISGTTYTDAYPLLFSEPCEQDNFFIFKEGNVVIEDEGALKCSASNAQQTSATYALNGSTLTIYGSDTTSFTNTSVEKEYLKGTITGDLGGTAATINITWTRQ